MQRIRKRGARPEQAIQKAVFQHLRARAAPNVIAFHVPSGGYRKPIEAAIFNGLGVVAGIPDICAVKEGVAYFLELKAAGGKLSEAQYLTMDKLRRCGAVVGVATGLDEALRWLEDHSLLAGKVA